MGPAFPIGHWGASPPTDFSFQGHGFRTEAEVAANASSLMGCSLASPQGFNKPSPVGLLCERQRGLVGGAYVQTAFWPLKYEFYSLRFWAPFLPK